MKKILFLSLMFGLVLGLGACTKRDKLTDNTMILQIEPASAISTTIGSEVKLRAIIRNIKMEEVDQPIKWSVVSSDLGSFSSKTSKSTTFMPENSGSGKIVLSCQGMEVSTDITIG